MSFQDIKERLREFVKERDWEKFHQPKNLIMALNGEVGELCEIFQWLTSQEAWKVMDDPKISQDVADEVADIAIYLIRLSDVLNIDLEQAIQNKMKKNSAKYPVELARGKAKKYTEL